MLMYDALASTKAQLSEQVLRHCNTVMRENYFVLLNECVSELGEHILKYRFFKPGVREEEIFVTISVLGSTPVMLTVEDETAGASKTFVINIGNSILQVMAFFDSYISQIRASYGVQYLPGYEQGGELTADNFCSVIRDTMQIMLPASKYTHATTLTIEQLLEDFTREYHKGATFFDFSIIFSAGSVLSFKALSKASEVSFETGYVMANEFLVVYGTGTDLFVPGTEITIFILMPDFVNDTDSDIFKA